MTDKNIYVCPLPSNRQRQGSQQDQAQRRLAQQGLLDQDSASVESVASQPSGERIEGQYLGKYADLMAAELQELADSTGYETVPYYATDQSMFSPGDGYVAIESMEVGRIDPNSEWAHRYSGTVSKAGTRSSHYRAVQATQRQLDHPFGNDTTAYIGVPAAATDVQWLSRDDGATEPATAVETRSAEQGDIDIVDHAASTFASPTLIYSIEYRHEGKLDTRTWDTRGFASRDDSDGLAQWVKSFLSTHDYDGVPVVENGLVRVWLEPNNFRVDGWDGAAWQQSSLGASDWELADVDIGHRADQDLSPVTVDALTTWTNPTNDDTYRLDVSLQRGAEAILFSRTPNATAAVPSGLQDLLSPVASATVVDPQPTRTIVAKSEVSA